MCEPTTFHSGSQSAATENSVPQQPIMVPFPPPVKVEDLINLKKDGEVPARSPNAFLIYRRLFVRELKAKNCTFKMTEVSAMASISWQNEPKYVKDEYWRIATDARNALMNARRTSLSFARRKQRGCSNRFTGRIKGASPANEGKKKNIGNTTEPAHVQQQQNKSQQINGEQNQSSGKPIQQFVFDPFACMPSEWLYMHTLDQPPYLHPPSIALSPDSQYVNDIPEDGNYFWNINSIGQSSSDEELTNQPTPLQSLDVSPSMSVWMNSPSSPSNNVSEQTDVSSYRQSIASWDNPMYNIQIGDEDEQLFQQTFMLS
ncbi:5856_t:CDS:1 [Paraglomus brasilianum]|uniref:5856_t:CDS:1 n=1 Tax=Paraglomus brasilianum TaxID=144538 RepID=A0A9N8VHC5_9GLOM|nr:5856_t:CDS:1 [Paraglomus brasilianum]